MTLESGEAEFEECLNAIKDQKFVEIEHLIARGLDEKSAHGLIASVWRKRSNEFDYLLKVDADTILVSNSSVYSMATLMLRESASGMQVRLWDYFSQTLISGLNMFSNDVKFKRRIPRLRPDNIDFGHTKVLKGESVGHLEPIGLHGKYPSPRQSFFFGYHRYLKGQNYLLSKCFDLWLVRGDEARKWAIIGALAADEQKFARQLYSSSRAFRAFEIKRTMEPQKEQITQFVLKKLKGRV